MHLSHSIFSEKVPVLKRFSTLSLREMVSFPQKQKLDIKFLANLTKWLGAAAIGG